MTSISRCVNIQKQEIQRLINLKSDIETHLDKLENFVSNLIYHRDPRLVDLLKRIYSLLSRAIDG